MKSRSLFVFLILISCWAGAQKAVLIEDPPEEEVKPLPTENYHSRPGSSSPRGREEPAEVISEDHYSSTYELRARRRMGVGAEVLGELGLGGAFVELNFAPDDSAVLGFGGGLQFSSFEVNWRHIFGGRTISPYVSLGVAHWYTISEGTPISNSIPSVLTDKFLTQSEIDAGKFSLNFIAPAAGLQYNVLSGSYAGAAVRAEAVLLTGLRGFQTGFLGSLGVLYYF